MKPFHFLIFKVFCRNYDYYPNPVDESLECKYDVPWKPVSVHSKFTAVGNWIEIRKLFLVTDVF